GHGYTVSVSHEWGPGSATRSIRKSRHALDGHLGHAVTRRDGPAAQGFPHNKEGEVKTRLTIGKPAKFRSKAANWQPNKRGPGPFEPGPRRKGQCRVSAPTASAFPTARSRRAARDRDPRVPLRWARGGR